MRRGPQGRATKQNARQDRFHDLEKVKTKPMTQNWRLTLLLVVLEKMFSN